MGLQAMVAPGRVETRVSGRLDTRQRPLCRSAFCHRGAFRRLSVREGCHSAAGRGRTLFHAAIRPRRATGACCAAPLTDESASKTCLPKGAGCGKTLWRSDGCSPGPPQSRVQNESHVPVKKTALDATDIRILSAVQAHGQLSKTRLSEIVNISATPCWARLDRLKAAGFIRGYHADIALNRVCDFTLVMVTVSLTHHRKADFDRFEAWVARHDEITECIATGGGMDYVLKTVCPTLSAFQDLMREMLETDLSVDRYMTYIATRVVKAGQPNIAKLVGAAARQT